MASSATSLLGFVLLTGNSVVAIHRSRRDAAAASFVGASYISLALLFYCLRWFETAPPRSTAKDRARVGVWLTATLLTAMFSWRVAALMPGIIAAGVCLMAAATTVIGGFYALFLLRPTGD